VLDEGDSMARTTDKRNAGAQTSAERTRDITFECENPLSFPTDLLQQYYLLRATASPIGCRAAHRVQPSAGTPYTGFSMGDMSASSEATPAALLKTNLDQHRGS